MTWTRLDDLWTEQKEIVGLSLEARWHYLCLIQLCSRSGRYDGVVRRNDALRCSDIDDPKAAMNEIYKAGMVTVHGSEVKLVRIEEHVPSPSTLAKTERDRIRKRRQRAHDNGDHSTCYRQRCEHGVLDEPTPKRGKSRVTSHVTEGLGQSHVTVTREVTRDVGTGRDGTGNQTRADSEQIDQSTGEVLEAHQQQFDDAGWLAGNPDAIRRAGPTAA